MKFCIKFVKNGRPYPDSPWVIKCKYSNHEYLAGWRPTYHQVKQTCERRRACSLVDIYDLEGEYIDTIPTMRLDDLE